MGISLSLLWLPAERERVKGVDVAVCYTFVPLPHFWVLLQTLSCAGAHLFNSSSISKCCFSQHCPRALWPVILTDLAGNKFWEVCCFSAGFAPAYMRITVSVWGWEEEITMDCVCISFSQRYCPLSYLHLANLLMKFQLWDTQPVTLLKVVTFIKCRSLFYIWICQRYRWM